MARTIIYNRSYRYRFGIKTDNGTVWSIYTYTTSEQARHHGKIYRKITGITRASYQVCVTVSSTEHGDII